MTAELGQVLKREEPMSALRALERAPERIRTTQRSRPSKDSGSTWVAKVSQTVEGYDEPPQRELHLLDSLGSADLLPVDADDRKRARKAEHWNRSTTRISFEHDIVSSNEKDRRTRRLLA